MIKLKNLKETGKICYSKLKNLIRIIKTFRNWWDYYFDFWFKKEGILTYKTRNGFLLEIMGNSDDRFILDEIFVMKLYNPHEFEIKEGDNVIDVGAQIGLFSMYASRLAKNGRIFAFEPDSKNLKMLQKNFILNYIKNVIIEKCAVSNKNGTKKLFISNGGKTSRHSFYKDYVEQVVKSVRTKTISLKKVLEKNKIKKVNFLKLDCEGAEYEILFFCPKETLNKIEKIVVECHNINKKMNIETLGNFLNENGFMIRRNKNYPILYAKRKV